MLEFLEKNKDITNLSNFKIKVKSKYYFEINNLEDLKKIKLIIKFAKQNKIKYLFI
jgi:UDP-N-acetylenolpyruvoylglucosamine reductase